MVEAGEEGGSASESDAEGSDSDEEGEGAKLLTEEKAVLVAWTGYQESLVPGKPRVSEKRLARLNNRIAKIIDIFTEIGPPSKESGWISVMR